MSPCKDGSQEWQLLMYSFSYPSIAESGPFPIPSPVSFPLLKALADLLMQLCLLRILQVKFSGYGGPKSSVKTFTEASFGPDKSKWIANISEMYTDCQSLVITVIMIGEMRVIRGKNSNVSRTQICQLDFSAMNHIFFLIFSLYYFLIKLFILLLASFSMQSVTNYKVLIFN